MKRVLALLAAGLVGLCATTVAWAITLAEAGFRPVPGAAATQLSVGQDGTVFAVALDGHVWRRRPAGPRAPWARLPGQLVRVAASSATRAWALDDGGQLLRYDGTWWRPMNFIATDVATGVRDASFAIDAQGRLFSLDARSGLPTAMVAPGELRRVAVDERGLPWVVQAGGQVQRFNGFGWTALPGDALDIAAAAGRIYIVTRAGVLQRWDAFQGQWLALAEGVAAVAAAPDGSPWVLTPQGALWAANPDTRRGDVRPVGPAPVFRELLPWRRVKGNAEQVASAANGAAYARSASGEVWAWSGQQRWTSLPGRFKRIAADPAGVPWGVASDGRVFQYRGNFWRPVGGEVVATDIAIGADDAVWVLQADGLPMRWNALRNEWIAVQPAIDARQLAVDPLGHPWIVDPQGEVWQHDGAAWLRQPGVAARGISIAPEGRVLVAGVDGRPWRFDASAAQWVQLNGDAATVSAGPSGRLWITTPQGGLFALASMLADTTEVPRVSLPAGGTPVAHDTLTAVPTPPGGGGAAAGRRDAPLSFQRLSGTGRLLAIGAEGSVFLTGFDSNLTRWSNRRNAFLSFPGQALRIAVTPTGRPWGVTTRGEVYRHDGLRWQRVYNIVAQDIAIGYDGTVMVADERDALQRYRPADDRFERVTDADENGTLPAGLKLAVNPAGRPWTIGRDGYVRRCERGPCERLPQRASEIAIGPEGTVMVVDANHALLRWNPSNARFELLRTGAEPLAAVAVGPLGKPWVVNGKFEVWAAGFFERDESQDFGLAAASGNTIAPDAPPVFTFTSNLVMDEVTWTGGAMTVRALAIGASGKVVVLKTNGIALPWNVLVYDPQRKKFVTDGSVPFPPVASPPTGVGAALAPDDTLWAWQVPANIGDPVKVWRFVNRSWSAVPGLTSDAAFVLTDFNVAFGRDGLVLATSPAIKKLFQYDVAANRFVPYALQINAQPFAVEIDPSGHVWVVAGFSPKVYEFDGASFQLHTAPSVTGDVCIGPSNGCLAIGANGSVLSWISVGFGQGQPVRWNPLSRAWDRLTLTLLPAQPSVDIRKVAVAPDGRVWVVDFQGKVFRAR